MFHKNGEVDSMNRFYTHHEWLDQLMPEGLPIPSSTVISGPGGSGKPLVGLAVVTSWLEQDGKVVLMSLQYPDRKWTEDDLSRLYDVQLDDYAGSFFFIRFDPDIEPTADTVERIRDDEVVANLVSPDAWEASLDLADQALGPSELGTLVFASALNLLLFSRTYGQRMLAHLDTTLREEKSRTYLFTVSSSALKEMIAKLESAADNLMFTDMDRQEKRLRLRVARLKEAPHLGQTIVAPFAQATLQDLKETADASRVARIATIRKI
ncbi:MAG: hypothetical protein ACP5G7_10325 [Anaerolineae bacterium]